MSVLLEEYTFNFTESPKIENNVSWLGRVSGLIAEKMLRGINKPYVYVLRAGENEMDYYVTFIHRDGSVRHQPFVITPTPQGWCYENATPGGPFVNTTIDEIVHRIMHCEKGECTPLINFNK